MSFRRSTRNTRGVAPTRYGYEEENQRNMNITGNISTENTINRNLNPVQETSSNASGRSDSIIENNRTIVNADVHSEKASNHRSRHSSENSKSHRTNSSRYTSRSLVIQEAEELNALENEKAERERKRENEEFERRKQLIMLKYRTNNMNAADDNSSRKSTVSQRSNESRIREWVKDSHTHQNSQANQDSRAHRNSHVHQQNKSNIYGDQYGNLLPSSNGNDLSKLTEVFTEVIKSVKNDKSNNEFTNKRYMLAKDLPNFSGNLEDWPNFIIQYERSTELCGFSDEENIIRLEKCLKGKAREAVKCLLISPRNVPEILQTLELNFGKPEHIIMTMIEQTKKIPAPKEYNLNTFMDFANGVRNLVTTIETLNCTNYLVNPQLLAEFTNKLSFNMKMNWANVIKNNHGNVTLRDFADWVKETSITISYVNTPEIKKDESKTWQSTKGNYQNNFQRKNTIFAINEIDETDTQETTPDGDGNAILNTSSNQTTQQYKPKCSFCQEFGHYLSECRKFIEINVDKRHEFITKCFICGSCLKKGHRSNRCRNKKLCNVNNCDKYHHVLLHKEQPIQTLNLLNAVNNEEECNNNGIESINHSSQQSSKVLLRVVPVVLIGPKAQIETYALLDECATTTLLDAELSEQLGLDGYNDPFSYEWLHNIKRSEANSRITSLQIKGIGRGMETYTLNKVRTAENLSIRCQTMNIEQLSSKFQYLKNAMAYSYENARPKILIGGENSMLTVARQVVHDGNKESPVLIETLLGWVIHGQTSSSSSSIKNNDIETCLFMHTSPDQQMHELIKQYFKTEDFGVKIINENNQSKLEKKGEEIMKSTIKKIDGENRYELGLLWRDEDEKLPESYSMAFKRLQVLEKKMDKDSYFAQKYTEQFELYIKKNFIHKLNVHEITSNKKEWYLPHFGVTNVNKPGKIRMVMDAAAKSNGLSLNDALLVGPDLLQSLVGILLNFRRHKYAFNGDIKEMFHQVKIRKEDQEAQRLLWRGNDRNRKPDVYEMEAMVFGLKCSPSMAQFGKNYNATQHEIEYPNAAFAIKKRHYVDDYLDCCETLEQANNLIAEVIEVHKRGGFVICNWNSNSSEVNAKIPKDLLKVQKQKDLQLDNSLGMERVLGLWWNCQEDAFEFNVQSLMVKKKVNGKLNPTKRDILKFTMSIYDPIGFVAPYTVRAKILLQDVWKSGVGWDDELSGTLLLKWSNWISQIEQLKTIKIPRCYSELPFSQAEKIDVHIFCDASEQAFGAVGYLRIEYQSCVRISFIASKNRVAPIKKLTIPRLELQAAVLGSRLAANIRTELNLNIRNCHYWSDSKTVLCWLKSEVGKFNAFVSHRIGEIQDTCNVDEWKWVPTKQNVADEITRDTSKCDLSPESRWWSGPDFLKFDENKWPNALVTDDLLTNEDEYQEEYVYILQQITNLKLPKIEYFSKWIRLVRSTAMLLRYFSNLKAKTLNQPIKTNELDPNEIEKATVLWNRQVQMECFQKEVEYLKAGKSIDKSSRIYQLSPFMDEDGVIRLNSRIQNADIDYNFKNPVILDSKHRYTELLLLHYHIKAGHHGMELVANEVKQKYWIINLKSAVRKCWHICQWCKNKRAKPSIPQMGQLPKARLECYVRPFTYTGVDYFGPFEVVIELASSLNTDSAIMAIRRMISRRGCPKEMFSDNGTNLKAAEKELRNSLLELNQNQIEAEMTSRNIKWHFIPPAAPHMGGSWERLVRSVKTALSVMLTVKCPREEVLQTVFAEVECLVNSRPLTDVSPNAGDLCSLTPNNFLMQTTSSAQPPGAFNDSDLNVRKQWRISQILLEHFWRRWTKEYLSTLLKRAKWYETQNPIQVDDVVLIMDNNLPRNQWLIGKVVSINPGLNDNIVRVATVKTSKSIYKRPVVKLCKLSV